MAAMTRITCASLLCVALGCTGFIDDPSRASATVEGESCKSELPPQSLALLAPRHYANAVRDLLGVASFPAPRNTGGSTVSFFANATERLTTVLAFELKTLAEEAGTRARAQAASLAPCSGDVETCARRFIERFGRRAFRRPLATSEVEALLAVYRVGREQDGAYDAGIGLVVEAMLQAPSFLYRRELGTSAEGAERLDAFELATMLSFFLVDTIPDEALLDAAEDGRLDDADGLRREVERLSSSREGRSATAAMVLRLFELPRLASAERNDTAFTVDLRASMAEETRRFVDDVLFERGGSLAELLSSRRSFVDARLAAHYGVAYPSGATDFVETLLPESERAGLLTQASWLTAFADIEETSVVKRGLFMARELLCEIIPAPPEGVVERTAETLAALPDERSRAEFRKSDGLCGACHRSIDAYGVLFETYDQLGRFRTELHGKPVDASWDVLTPESIAGPATALVPVLDQLAQAPEVRACIATKVASYAFGRPLTAREACNLADVARSFAGGDDLTALVREVALWPGLRVRKGGAP